MYNGLWIILEIDDRIKHLISKILITGNCYVYFFVKFRIEVNCKYQSEPPIAEHYSNINIILILITYFVFKIIEFL